MFKTLFKESRKCPYCEYGQLAVRELASGTNCSSCGRFVELDFRVSAGIPIVLAGLVYGCFENGWNVPGYFLAAGMVVFTAGYQTLFTGYLPLRDYSER